MPEGYKSIGEFECRGKWWLPYKPELKISGVLKFSSKDGGTLELFGMLDPENKVYITKRRDFPIIVGLTTDDEEITLKDCFEISYALDSINSNSSLDFTSLFRKAHFMKEKDINFTSVDANYTYLEEWIGISGLIFLNDDEGKGSFSIKYKPPELCKVIIDNFSLSIIYKTEKSIGHKNISVSKGAYFRIEFNDKKEHSFEEFLSIIHKIKNFLSLCIWVEPVFPIIIEGKTELNKKTFNDKMTFHPSVEILLQDKYIQTEKDVGIDNILVRFADINDRLTFCLNNWFKKTELLDPFFNLYFGLLYNPNLYLPLQFLSLTQALEFYHRKIYGDKYVSNEEYQVIYDTLFQAIPPKTNEKLKERLKEYLNYGNEFSLRKRLKDILKELDWLMFLLFEKEEDFINEVVKLRNYFTHYSAELLVDSHEIFHAVEVLNRIVTAIMLKEIGFASEELVHLFTNNRLFWKIL